MSKSTTGAALAEAVARGQKEDLSMGELRDLSDEVQANSSTMAYAADVLGVLRRQMDHRLTTAKTKLDLAAREHRALLASEDRAVTKAKDEATALRGLMDAVQNAQHLRDAAPSTQVMFGAEPTTRGFLPTWAEYRAQALSPDSAGGFAVPVQTANLIFDRLRPASIVLSAGVQVVDMATNDATIPGLSTSATAGMFAENAEISTSAMTFTGVSLSAKKMGAVVLASNEVLADAVGNLRAFVERDLVQTMAATLDHQLLEGDASGSSLRGLRRLSGVNTTTLGGGGGAVIMLDDVLNAIARVQANNGRPSAIVTSPKVAAQLAASKDGEGKYYLNPFPAAAGADTLFGLPVLVSSQINTTETIGAQSTHSWLAVVDASQLVVGRRLDTTLLVDPFSRSTYDQTLIRVTSRWAGLGVLNAGAVELVLGCLVA